jgi:ubiquinone/menaquinone biosynthesis C-methylase UbiE
MNREKIISVWNNAADIGEDIHPAERDFFPMFLKIAQNSKSILEIGVGRGRMVKILMKHRVHADFYSVDIAPSIEHVPGNKTLADARNLPFKANSFNLTYSIGVVEHFPETLQAIGEHARVTKPGGYVFVTTPRRSIFTIARILLFYIKLKRSYNASFEVVLGRNIALREMKYFFEQADLEVFRLSSSGPVIPSANPLLQRISSNLPLSSDKWGAYLYCLGQKRSVRNQCTEKRDEQNI